MALGKKILEIDGEEIILGMSTSGQLSDGIFSPDSYGINLFTTPGTIRQQQVPTDKSSGLTGEIIASCEDQTGSYTRVFVSTDTDQDGRFFSASSDGTLTARGVEDTGANYIDGRTDMIDYRNEVYTTNSTYIVRWSSVGGANTFNYTFFSFNDSAAPHPALVFEDNAYYGDGNRLLRQTSAGGTPTTILTLPTGQIITALGIDPGSGKMLIGTVGQYNVSNTLNTMSRVLFYDGFSNKASRSVIMDDMVTAFPTTAGDLYVAYGSSLGYWNGSGSTFLRKYDIDDNNQELLYKHRFTSYGQTLFSVQKNDIIAHGPLRIGGGKVFYPIIRNYLNNSNNIRFVTYLGTGGTDGILLAFSAASDDFFTTNLNSVSTGGDTLFYSNKYSFSNISNDGVWIRRVVITTKEKLGTSGDTQTLGSLYLLNENGIVDTIGNGGLFPITNSSGAQNARTEIVIGGGMGTKFTEFQLRIGFNSQATTSYAIEKITVFGDPANVT